MNVVYVTGNLHKAHYFSKMVGIEIPHKSVDVMEIQSLDPEEVISHKAKAAYLQLNQPVIVEDTFLRFEAMGALPGTFVKWFLDEIGPEGLCKMVHSFSDNNNAVAGALIAYYDGKTLRIFRSELSGTIAKLPQGDSGFGWNRIFIPEGSDKTLGEMEEQEFEHYYKQIKPFNQIHEFLDKI